jgi:DNA-binding phage protein
MNLTEIKQRLADRKLPVVAEATGLSVYTLYRVVNGKGRPSKSTLRSIETYLRGTSPVALNG